MDNKPQQVQPDYYVAIGASAGGLEALQLFFLNLNNVSNAAFIVVQHLAPDFKSVMVDLIAKYTTMKVVAASDSTEVLANSIYIIPPGKNMMIGDGKLILSDQMSQKGPNFPIDIFFRSLAEDRQHASVSIVLSGTGSDGSRGITATKEVGGLVMVQEPTSAKFNGMPLNAISTQCADIVADPKELANKLTHYLTNPLIMSEDRRPSIENNDLLLAEIYSLMSTELNIDFSLYKPQTIMRRIERRMCINQLSELNEYYVLLQQRRDELQALTKDMLIGVTRCFRDETAFSYIENHVFPSILENLPTGDTLRIWSAGCSTGEEAVSLAILADEYAQRTGKAFSVKIFATDVDSDTIQQASLGRYPPNIMDDLGQERFSNYFELNGDSYELIPRVRKMIIFAVHNLISDPPFSNVHLAVCRNVLIYFQAATQRRILMMLQFALKLNGYLFLGPSESHSPIDKYVSVENAKYKVFKKTSALLSLQAPEVNMLRPDRRRAPAVDKVLKSYEKNNTASYGSLIESILEDKLPPSILISDDQNVIHFYGDIEQYTERPSRGKVTSSILDILTDSLTIPAATALKEADIEKKPKVVLEDIPIIHENSSHKVRLEVNAYRNSKLSPVYYLLSIITMGEMAKDDPSTQISIESFDVDKASLRRIKDLENEIRLANMRLQITVDELESTNEELQSSNEELLAANEELQSTNEELQSVNEELYTVNSEYQIKIDEVVQSNNDLDTLVSVMDIGVVFLSSELLIRRFSAAATRHINLLPNDIGRPFHHIAHRLDYPLILNDIAQVIATRETKSTTVPIKDDIGKVNIRIIPSLRKEHDLEYVNCILTIQTLEIEPRKQENLVIDEATGESVCMD